MTVKVSVLPNGVSVITDRRREAKSLYSGVWVGHGSRHDPRDSGGFSHLYEHMLFRSTQHRTTHGVARAIEGKGGTLDAGTEREITMLSVHGGPKPMGHNIGILAEMLLHPAYNNSDLRSEISTVVNEIKGYVDEPAAYAIDLLYRIAYPKQKFGGFILGSEETLKRITPQQLASHSRRSLTGNNLVFVAVGNVDHGKFYESVEQNFGHLRSGKRQSSGKAEFHNGFMGQVKGHEQTYMAIGLPGPENTAKDLYAAHYLTMIMGDCGSMTSRLYQKARHKGGLVYTPDMNLESYSDTGLFIIQAATDPLKVRDLIAIVGKEVCNLGACVQQSEFLRAREKNGGDLAISYDNLPRWANHLGSMALAFGTRLPPEELRVALSYEETLRHYNSVTAQDVRKLAEQVGSSYPTLVGLGLEQDNPIHYGEILQSFGHHGPHNIMHKQRKGGIFFQKLAA